jgi:hypothetical protein
MELVKSLEGAQAEAQCETPEGQIVRVLLDLGEKVLGGRLETQEIVNALNEGKPDRFHTATVSAGKRLAALGFTQTKLVGGKRGICYDKALIEELSVQYGHTPEKSVQPAPSAQNRIKSLSAEGQMKNGYDESDKREMTDRIDGTDLPSICPPANADMIYERADRTDRTDYCKVRPHTSLEKHHELTELSSTYVPEPDLPEGF